MAPRLLVVIAGCFGAGGVGLWAWGTHAGLPSVAVAAQMLLFHATALIALASAGSAGLLPMRPALWLGVLLALGVALFSGDMVVGAVSGQRLFPMASPAGGMLIIAGWAGLAITALFARR